MELSRYRYIQINQAFYYKLYILVHPVDAVSTPTKVNAHSRSNKESGVNL
jgi:hypothetical protein